MYHRGIVLKDKTVKTSLFLLSMILGGLLALALEAKADDYLVWQYSDNVRVVLTEFPCRKPNVGLRVMAQRIDGNYVNGCYVPEGKDMIRITWSNNDFAILELKHFVPVSETMYNLMNR